MTRRFTHPLSTALALLVLTGCSTHAHPRDSARTLTQGRTVRILALGDSITRGSGEGYGNYRRPLQSLLAREGYHCLFVGESTEQSFNYHGADPEQTFTPYQPNHEGYGGFQIDQIASNIPVRDDGGVTYPGLKTALAAGNPDIVLLMIGTNDIRYDYDPGGPGYGGATGFAAGAAKRLDSLLTRLFDVNPHVTVVLAAVTPFSDDAKDAMARAYNAFIPRIVADRRARGQNVLFADMHGAVAKGDLAPDGVHPATIGGDKIARAWFTALTGTPAPPLPADRSSAFGPGRLNQPNAFTPANTVTVSSVFAGGAFVASSLVDGSARAFVFGDAAKERVAVTGFHGPIGRLRFFDTPSYTGRTPRTVTIYYSSSLQSSLNPADYVKVGAYSLPAVGDAYDGRTSPVAHPAVGEPAGHPDAVIGFCDLDGLSIPGAAQSLLLDFSKAGGDGDGISEIQAFISSRRNL